MNAFIKIWEERLQKVALMLGRFALAYLFSRNFGGKCRPASAARRTTLSPPGR
jgi:hypothetical protein